MSGMTGVTELQQRLALTEAEHLVARGVLDAVPCMLALWDRDQRCVFANRAYEQWFGVHPDQLIGRTLQDLLGPIYALNRPYIEAALRGEPQQFEREIPNPAGGPTRHSLANYIPKIDDTGVVGFYVLVTDVTRMKQAEAEARDARQVAETALQQLKELRALLPMCAWCHRIRDDAGQWHTVDQYFARRPDIQLTHGICTHCASEMLDESAKR